MYKGGSDIKVSAPDAKRCEEALKAVGIIKYVRGDYVTEDDIEPEPLTWDELHNYIGKLVAHDVSTESHKWLKVCWIYDIQDKGEGNLIYNDGGSGYGYSRCSTVNGDLTRDFSPYLKHSGRFFCTEKIGSTTGAAAVCHRRIRRLHKGSNTHKTHQSQCTVSAGEPVGSVQRTERNA